MSHRGARRRLLLTSSDPETANTLGAVLAHQGYDVSLARSLAAARHGLEQSDYALLLLDLHDQGESGLRLLRDLRSGVDDAALPVIALTEEGESILAARALRAGANRCLPKPIQPAVLAACAEVVVGEAAVQRSARREQQLLEQLRAVDEALSANAAGKTSAGAESRASLEHTRPDAIYHTDEYVAAPSEIAQSAVPQPAAVSSTDTAEQAAVDWTLFRAVEQALSQSLEQHRPLSVLMVEAWPPTGMDRDAFDVSLALVLRKTLPAGASARRLEGHVHCVVLPEADEDGAVTIAKRLLAAVTTRPVAAPAIPQPDRVHVGVATLPPDFEGSPFRLIDHARHALERARREGRSGWWVQRAQLAR